MKIKLALNLGNRGLLPDEVGVVEIVNEKLRQSAARHGKKLKPTSAFVVKRVDTQGEQVHRAASSEPEPEVPMRHRVVHG